MKPPISSTAPRSTRCRLGRGARAGVRLDYRTAPADRPRWGEQDLHQFGPIFRAGRRHFALRHHRQICVKQSHITRRDIGSGELTRSFLQWLRGIRRSRGMGRSCSRQRRVRGRKRCCSDAGALAASGIGSGLDDPRRPAQARRLRRDLRRGRAAQGGRGRTNPQGPLHHSGAFPGASARLLSPSLIRAVCTGRLGRRSWVRFHRRNPDRNRSVRRFPRDRGSSQGRAQPDPSRNRRARRLWW